MKMWRLTYSHRPVATACYRHTAIKIEDDDRCLIVIEGGSAGYEGDEGDYTKVYDYDIWLRDHRVKDCIPLEKRTATTWVPETHLEE